MNIVETPEGKHLVVDVEGGKPIQIPVREALLDIIEDVKKLSNFEYALIIRDAGVTVPDGAIDNEGFSQELLYLAMSFVQNGWYQATGVATTDPERWKRVQDGHEARLARFAEKLAKVPTTAEPKAAKAPKAPREPRVVTASGPKPVSTARISGRLYTLNVNGDVNLVANLTGFQKAIYEAVKSMGDNLSTFEVVLERSKANGTVFKGADGGKNQVAYCLKVLVAANLVTLVGADAPPQQPRVETAATATVN
jgi:hypothetical protein